MPTIIEQNGRQSHALLVGDDHDLLSGRTVGDPHPQYGHALALLASIPKIFVPAANFGAIPNTGAIMTSSIQAAFDGCPIGSTLVFEPGVYLTHETLILSHAINVWAYGAVFDLTNFDMSSSVSYTPSTPTTFPDATVPGREANPAATKAAFIYGSDGLGNRCERVGFYGLKIRRTPDAGFPNQHEALSHTGLLVWAPQECEIVDVTVESFACGIVMQGRTGTGGCVHNILRNVRTTDCRYSLTMYTNPAGGSSQHCNSNTIISLRNHVSSNYMNDPLFVSGAWELVRMLWASGGTSPSPPNNNVFMNCTWQSGTTTGQPPGPPIRDIARKLRLEGSENSFIACRWETPDVTTGLKRITIGESSRSNSFFSRNYFLHGVQLYTMVARDLIEFLNTATPNNNSNTFDSGSANWHAARVDAGDTFTTAHRFQSTSSLAPTLGINSALGKERFRLWPAIASPFSALGTIEFLDDAVPPANQNWLGMEGADPWDLRTFKGLNIADVLRARISTFDANDAEVQHPSFERIWMNARAKTGEEGTDASGGYNFFSGNQQQDHLIRILDSARDLRMVVRANNPALSVSNFGAIDFYQEATPDSPVFANALFMPNLRLPVAIGEFPLAIERGLIVNPDQVNADTRISGQTEINLFYVDASGDNIGIATPPTAGILLDVNGKIRGRAEVEIDGDLNHDGTNIGFYNVAPVPRPAAYTQTFATPNRTHAARTAAALTDNIGGTVGTTLAAIPDPADAPASADALRDDLVANVLPLIRNALSSLADQANKGRADALNTGEVLNSSIDDDQAQGLKQ